MRMKTQLCISVYLLGSRGTCTGTISDYTRRIMLHHSSNSGKHWRDLKQVSSENLSIMALSSVTGKSTSNPRFVPVRLDLAYAD